MIDADLHGKRHISEDILTSCCFGLLRLLPDQNLIEVLSLSRHYNGRRLRLDGTWAIADFEFWPWLRDGGEPDAIVTLTSSSRRIKIVIEVKHGAGKSGEEDQLAKYYNAATIQYPDCDIFVIYLTHHRDMPADDLKHSLNSLSADALIHWLSWHDVSKWTMAKICEPGKKHLIESRILLTLRDYLLSKGYRRFESVVNVASRIMIQSPYIRTYIICNDLIGTEQLQTFGRLYLNKSNINAIATFYKARGTCHEL